MNALSRFFSALKRPEYVFRPSQVVRRLAEEFRGNRSTASVMLPWSLEIEINPQEAIGRAIATLGLYDLCVTETVARLASESETAVDAGANIGYLTGLMAVRVGPKGVVFAMEPHPDVFARLRGNVARWKLDPTLGRIRALNIALGRDDGFGDIVEPEAFAVNEGTAKVIPAASIESPGVEKVIGARIARLESVVPDEIGLLKMDVEGAEPEVLAGATGLLRRHAIRDIVFEDYGSPPSPTMSTLLGLGYEVFALRKTLLGPGLEELGKAGVPAHGEAPSYVATSQPGRALALMRAPGWKCLRGTP